MVFHDYNSGAEIELRFTRKGLRLAAEILTRFGNAERRIPFELVSAEDIALLKGFLEDPSEERSFAWSTLPFAIRWGWFEKGEGYYTVQAAEQIVYEYDQLGGSNRFRLAKLNEELTRTGWSGES